jgi:hypothetical protein
MQRLKSACESGYLVQCIYNLKYKVIVDDIVLAVNSDKVLYGVVRMYPGFVSGIQNQVEEINFYLLSNG